MARVLLPRHAHCYAAGLGSSPFARRYWGNRCYFLFLRVLRCFSSPRSPPAQQDVGIAPDGLPHSDIRGSRDICSSPRLFAACHVLLRLREPRHPPCALHTFRFTVMHKVHIVVLPKPFFYRRIATTALVVFLLSFYFVFSLLRPDLCQSESLPSCQCALSKSGE